MVKARKVVARKLAAQELAEHDLVLTPSTRGGLYGGLPGFFWTSTENGERAKIDAKQRVEIDFA